MFVDLGCPDAAAHLSKLLERGQEQLRPDVIIRDVLRIDDYPELSEKKGISSWFKVGLLDTYDRGILLGLEWVRLAQPPWLDAAPQVDLANRRIGKHV